MGVLVSDGGATWRRPLVLDEDGSLDGGEGGVQHGRGPVILPALNTTYTTISHELTGLPSTSLVRGHGSHQDKEARGLSGVLVYTSFREKSTVNYHQKSVDQNSITPTMERLSISSGFVGQNRYTIISYIITAVRAVTR